jgi:hypothetical protein
MSIACGADPFFVGSDILDLGSRKSELRGRRNRMAPLDHAIGIPDQMMVPSVANVSFTILSQCPECRCNCSVTLDSAKCCTDSYSEPFTC